QGRALSLPPVGQPAEHPHQFLQRGRRWFAGHVRPDEQAPGLFGGRMNTKTATAAPAGGGLAEVLAVLAKATPGPWHGMVRGDYGYGTEGAVNGPDGNELDGAEFTTAGNAATIRGQMREMDARAIVAAVNYLRSHGEAIAELIEAATELR